ncbi:MAG: transglutaminase-like superfamily [Lachnospiraceae bacterium]|nr:transglutaminase-like superfamily [Lachnospiraceae bacterium]
MNTKRKCRNVIYRLLFAIICVGLSLAVYPKAEEDSDKVNVLECYSVDYNRICLRIEAPEDKETLNVYRATSEDGPFELIDTIEYYGHWLTIESDTVKSLSGINGKLTCYMDEAKNEYRIYDSGLSFHKRYYYKVAYETTDNDGEGADVVSAVTEIAQVNFTACYTASASSVMLKWNSVSGAQGYYVYRKVSGGSWKRIKTVTGKTSYTDKTVKRNKKYYYRIRAYRKLGSKKYAGSYSSSLSVKVKNPTVSGSYSTGSVYGSSLSSSELMEVRRAVQGFKDNYIKSGMSDYQKVLAAYNYLRATCGYAWNGWQYNGANTAWGALIYGEAQCSGYARAMKALCDGIGIKCYYVHANSSSANPSHQWNEVKVGEKWYILDAQGGFFLVSAKTYKTLTGMDWNTSGLPTCKKDHSKCIYG